MTNPFLKIRKLDLEKYTADNKSSGGIPSSIGKNLFGSEILSLRVKLDELDRVYDLEIFLRENARSFSRSTRLISPRKKFRRDSSNITVS